MWAGNRNVRKPPATCSKESEACENLLQRAARNCNPAKASCNVQQGIVTLRKLPATCSKEL